VKRLALPSLLFPLVTVISCTEASPTVAPRFAVLDDVGESNWLDVTTGRDHTCALKVGGVAFCWGSNQFGQLGTQRSDTLCGPKDSNYICVLAPVAVEVPYRFRSISAGTAHTCGVTEPGEAYCWGLNTNGQLGDISRGGPFPVRIPTNVPWTQISAGDTHTCAVRSDGALFCWGSNDRGQVGNGGLSGITGISRVQQLPSGVASVSAGTQRTCARLVAGAVYCWGGIWFKREGGLEYTQAQPQPRLVPQSPAMTRISVGALTTCGTDASGFGYCWEANPRGEMGTGDNEGSTTPRRIASNLELIQISAGLVQTCAIATSGTGYCWGDDTFGQLGTSPFGLAERCGGQQFHCSTVPVPVFGRQQFTAISTGPGSHACGVTTRGNLYCWGLGSSGQRGDGSMVTGIALPIKAAEPHT
jgi:alpha-tubulin suppressor-like RCC1 family protein